MSPAGGPACGPEGHCVTCSDEAIPLRVVRGSGPGLAICVGEDGVAREVMTTLVEPIRDGDLLLVHAGTALQRLELPEGEAAP